MEVQSVQYTKYNIHKNTVCTYVLE